MKIVLTGAGSLVGQCVLDCLEGRRENLHLIGANLDPHAVNLHRCDQIYPLPPVTDAAAFTMALGRLIDREAPDLVIPCRDPDIPILAAWQDAGAAQAPILVGPTWLAELMMDKWKLYCWARHEGLPFAQTVLSGQPESLPNGLALVEEFGFPLIVKPRRGSGSTGIRVLLNHSQLERTVGLQDMLIQPFYDIPQGSHFALDLAFGLPLFWEIPCPYEFGGQFLIGPDGAIGPHLAFGSSHRLGRVESQEPCPDERLAGDLMAFAKAFAKAGWRGPLNIQARRDGHSWRVIEVNGRFSGGTSARYLLGLDEVGWIINAWAGAVVVPGSPNLPAAKVQRLFTNFSVLGATTSSGRETEGNDEGFDPQGHAMRMVDQVR